MRRVRYFVSHVVRRTVGFETSHATGVSAMVGGVVEAVFSPVTWLVIVVAFGAAFLLVRKTAYFTCPLSRFRFRLAQQFL